MQLIYAAAGALGKRFGTSSTRTTLPAWIHTRRWQPGHTGRIKPRGRTPSATTSPHSQRTRVKRIGALVATERLRVSGLRLSKRRLQRLHDLDHAALGLDALHRRTVEEREQRRRVLFRGQDYREAVHLGRRRNLQHAAVYPELAADTGVSRADMRQRRDAVLVKFQNGSEVRITPQTPMKFARRRVID